MDREMGTDIHTFAERFDEATGTWHRLHDAWPFEWRDYSIFAFLAGVRNYSGVRPVAENRGIPKDATGVQAECDDWKGDAPSWIGMEELLAVNYDEIIKDKRDNDREMTLREFLGPEYFQELKRLQAEGVDRIIFFFEN